MPRTAKRTISGDKPQPISPVAGQEYGMGQAQMDMQRQLPAPQVAPVPVPTGSPPTTPADTGVQAPEQNPAPLDAMAAAKAMAGGDGLLQAPPSGHPVTAGLASGPGAGPEALGQGTGSPTRDAWMELSKLTGDPYFANLAIANGL